MKNWEFNPKIWKNKLDWDEQDRANIERWIESIWMNSSKSYSWKKQWSFELMALWAKKGSFKAIESLLCRGLDAGVIEPGWISGGWLDHNKTWHGSWILNAIHDGNLKWIKALCESQELAKRVTIDPMEPMSGHWIEDEILENGWILTACIQGQLETLKWLLKVKDWSQEWSKNINEFWVESLLECLRANRNQEMVQCLEWLEQQPGFSWCDKVSMKHIEHLEMRERNQQIQLFGPLRALVERVKLKSQLESSKEVAHKASILRL